MFHLLPSLNNLEISVPNALIIEINEKTVRYYRVVIIMEVPPKFSVIKVKAVAVFVKLAATLTPKTLAAAT